MEICIQDDSKYIYRGYIGGDDAAIHSGQIIGSKGRVAFPDTGVFRGGKIREHPRSMVRLQDDDGRNFRLRKNRINHNLGIGVNKLYLLGISLWVFVDCSWKFIRILKGECAY